MDGPTGATRTDTTALARMIRRKASELEKMADSAAAAVDHNTPKPVASEQLKPSSPDGNLINDTLRSALRTLNRVEDCLSELHSRLGNPFADKNAAGVEEAG